MGNHICIWAHIWTLFFIVKFHTFFFTALPYIFFIFSLFWSRQERHAECGLPKSERFLDPRVANFQNFFSKIVDPTQHRKKLTHTFHTLQQPQSEIPFFKKCWKQKKYCFPYALMQQCVSKKNPVKGLGNCDGIEPDPVMIMLYGVYILG